MTDKATILMRKQGAISFFSEKFNKVHIYKLQELVVCKSVYIKGNNKFQSLPQGIMFNLLTGKSVSMICLEVLNDQRSNCLNTDWKTNVYERNIVSKLSSDRKRERKPHLLLSTIKALRTVPQSMRRKNNAKKKKKNHLYIILF